MKSARSRIVFLYILSASLITGSGLMAIYSSHEHSDLLKKYSLSSQITEKAVALHLRQLSAAEITEYANMLKDIDPEFRIKASNDHIKNANTENLRFVLRVESEYRKFLEPSLKYLKNRTEFYGTILIISSLLFSTFILYSVMGSIFLPLKQLSTKMTDFINNRYSYEFSIPEANEVGDLHDKFNLMAQKVMKQLEELKALDKAKSEFLSIASHELRTPLTSIKGSLSLLNSGVAGAMNEPTKQLMTIALDETDRLIRIINELLDLAKIEARQFALKPEWVFAEDICMKTFKALDGFCGSTNIKLVATGTEHLELEADPDRLQQVLTNLLSNAIKYSPANQTVTVAFSQTESGLLLVEVSDKGKGIAPEDQELIFEKFRQATNSQNPLVKGTGLGLAIAKSLVEQHGGTIGVRSFPGQGSTFYFTLPNWRFSKKSRAIAV